MLLLSLLLLLVLLLLVVVVEVVVEVVVVDEVLPLTVSARRFAVQGLSSGSDSDYSKFWVDWFLSSKGHEYFCEIDEDFIVDKFNMTGLSAEVPYYQQALDLLNDTLGTTNRLVCVCVGAR